MVNTSPDLKAISPPTDTVTPLEDITAPPLQIDRLGMTKALSDLIDNSAQGSLSLALICIDINEFREINLSSGFDVGDAVLNEVVFRLSRALRQGDLLFRIGDDEFVILLPSILHEDHAILAAHKISSTFEELIVVHHSEPMDVRASIGIALYPDTADSEGELLRQATIARYRAKSSKSPFELYKKVLTLGNIPPVEFARELRRAVSNNDLELYFQPKFDLSSQTMTGVEALCRWTHATHGVISPVEFIPVAEETGIITSITSWALNSALRQCSEWRVNGKSVVVSVNLSAYDLDEGDFPELIQRALRTWRVDPSQLMLEITETTMMRDQKRTIGILRRLSELGVSLSIDDFGSGYSSLNYLQQMPVHELKIEKDFVFKMERSESDIALVRTVVELGHNYDLKVTAEGVETEAAANLLVNMGCDFAQGQYFSPPITADELVKFLD
jgi:diguanylate cyclase (GGDEF)-like protein